MAERENKKTTSDAVPSSKADDLTEHFKSIYSDQLDHERTRQKVKALIDEYVDSVSFMEKVRKYAGYEIDSRLFVSAKFWALTAAAALLSSIITTAVVKFFDK